MSNLLNIALSYHAAGLSGVPDHPAAKYPVALKGWETITVTEALIRQWWPRWPDRGIGVRDVEGLDFDNKGQPSAGDLYSTWYALIEELAPGLADRLLLECTPSGGYHTVWRCEVIQGNQKLATCPPTPAELSTNPKARSVTLIETRGTGGQFMIAPSPGYTLLHGDWTQLPSITPAERQIVLDCARTLTKHAAVTITGAGKSNGTGPRPGDEYNAGGADDVLEWLIQARLPVARGTTRPASAQLPAELGADACPWLGEYIAFSRRWSPQSYDGFHEACALWVLSTIAARRMLLPFGGERFTNLYIALCARTSLWAKSTAAKIAKETISAAGLGQLLAPDTSTPQAFLVRLAERVPANYDKESPEAQTAHRASLVFAGQRGWWHEEFGSHLVSMMREGGMLADFRGHLRILDDCPPSYAYDTVVRCDTSPAPPTPIEEVSRNVGSSDRGDMVTVATLPSKEALPPGYHVSQHSSGRWQLRAPSGAVTWYASEADAVAVATFPPEYTGPAVWHMQNMTFPFAF